jgi:hypothetical protein
MNRRSILAACAVASCAVLIGAAQARAAGLQMAVAESKRTGKPMLVIGSSDT